MRILPIVNKKRKYIMLYRLDYTRHNRETLESETKEIIVWVALRQSEKLYLAPFCGILI